MLMHHKMPKSVPMRTAIHLHSNEYIQLKFPMYLTAYFELVLVMVIGVIDIDRDWWGSGATNGVEKMFTCLMHFSNKFVPCVSAYFTFGWLLSPCRVVWQGYYNYFN